MTSFTDLMFECSRGESTLLHSARLGPCETLRIVVQRSDGTLWGASDLFSEGADEAERWSVNAMKWAYLHAVQFPALDGEALYRAVEHIKAVDERAAAVEAAEYLVSKRCP